MHEKVLRRSPVEFNFRRSLVVLLYFIYTTSLTLSGNITTFNTDILVNIKVVVIFPHTLMFRAGIIRAVVTLTRSCSGLG